MFSREAFSVGSSSIPARSERDGRPARAELDAARRGLRPAAGGARNKVFDGYSSGLVGSDEMEGELRAAQHPVLDGDAAAMQFDNALHNRKPQSGAALLVAIPAPEALKDQLPFLRRDAGTAIQHLHCAVFLDDQFDQG